MATKTYTHGKFLLYLGDRDKTPEERRETLERIAEKVGADPSKLLRFLIDQADKITQDLEKIK